MSASNKSEPGEPLLWGGVGHRLNEGLAPDSTDRWPEPMCRDEFQVPMAMWNVLGKRRLVAAENVIGSLNISQAERRELEETWTMIQTDDLMFDRYPPESRPRPFAMESNLESIDEDEEFLLKANREKRKLKNIGGWLKSVCCLRKKETARPLPKPKVRTFKVNRNETLPATPEIIAQSFAMTTQTMPPRRLMRHSLMAEYAESLLNTESGPSCHVSEVLLCLVAAELRPVVHTLYKRKN
ncbi:uncharacterized protein BROUX77_006878 [Berkeleyomyces rouxiae]|uniref:uncharacterized protein n=1 Tax=Berkeleyomyces rouxiae TaxID=2035830 RepID=UPI003B806E5B